MNQVNIKQIKNYPFASKGATIIYDGNKNVWSNQDNGALLIPSGTSAQRPISAINGFLRYNSGSNLFEFYENGLWKNLDNIEVSSLGISGQRVYEFVSGNSELIFRKIEGKGIVDVYSLSGMIIISANSQVTNSALGGGINPIFTVSGREIITRTFVGGGIVEVSAASDGRIIVSAPQATQNQNITLSSFGGGVSLFVGVSANREIQLRSLLGGGIVEAFVSGNLIQLSASRSTIETSSLGGVSLGLNVSAGTGNRNELRIRGLVGGGIIEVSALSNVVSISASPASLNITNSALGGGINPIFTVSGREIMTRTFVGGGIVEVSALSDGRIIVSSISLNSVSSLGGGFSIVQSVSSNREILFRTFENSSDVLINVSGNVLSFQVRKDVVNDVSGIPSEPILYTISTARSSAYLSVETTTVLFSRAGNVASNSIIYSSIVAVSARLPMPYPCRIIRATGSITSNSGSVKNISILVENVEYPNILSFPITTTNAYSFNTNINIPVKEGQGIAAIVRGGLGSLTNVSVCLWLKIYVSAP